MGCVPGLPNYKDEFENKWEYVCLKALCKTCEGLFWFVSEFGERTQKTFLDRYRYMIRYDFFFLEKQKQKKWENWVGFTFKMKIWLGFWFPSPSTKNKNLKFSILESKNESAAPFFFFFFSYKDCENLWHNGTMMTFHRPLPITIYKAGTPRAWAQGAQQTRKASISLVNLSITGSGWIVIRILKRALIKCLHWLLPISHPWRGLEYGVSIDPWIVQFLSGFLHADAQCPGYLPMGECFSTYFWSFQKVPLKLESTELHSSQFPRTAASVVSSS